RRALDLRRDQARVGDVHRGIRGGARPPCHRRSLRGAFGSVADREDRAGRAVQWERGKSDRVVVVLWVARHVYGGRLDYIGYGGTGKQVRDVLHVDDLCALVEIEIDRFENLGGSVFAVGGGRRSSTSLLELTSLCRRITG